MTRATTTRPPKALLLDDDPTVLRPLGTALEGGGYEVRAAWDGHAGVALLLDELLGLDVVVVGADLPGRGARALLDLVRRAGGERELGVVVLADVTDPAEVAELVSLGADAVVERRAGHGPALEAIAAVIRRTRPPSARRRGRAAREVLHDALRPTGGAFAGPPHARMAA